MNTICKVNIKQAHVFIVNGSHYALTYHESMGDNAKLSKTIHTHGSLSFEGST